MKLETERLFLREMTTNDYDALYAVLADSDIMQHYPYKFDEERVMGWIARNIERYKTDGFGLWAVCLKENGKMIGDCGLTLQNINSQIKPEIGYHIAKAYQRKGYAKEAAQSVLDWAFKNTDFDVLYSYMKATKLPSIATAKANKMTFIEEYTDSENEQTAVYGISKKDWASGTINGEHKK